VHEFVQNSVFSPWSARFVIFALGAPLLSDFQQTARVCAKQRFQPEISTFRHFGTGSTTFYRFSAKCTSLCKTEFLARVQHVLSFSHWSHYFLVIFSKVHEFLQNSVFSPWSACFVIFPPGYHFLATFNKVHEIVQNSVFSPRSARFFIFALCVQLLSTFQQRARVCPKSKTALLARDQHVLSFSHCAHQLLAIFSKVHEFVRNRSFQPEISKSCHFRTGHTTF